MFSDCLDLAIEYAELLCTAGVDRGLIGPREAPRVWERHILNCAVVTPAVPESAAVADVGSGAGLPGLSWAIRRPDLEMTLVEPLLRRATFLTECVEVLGLGRQVRVERVRAEELLVADGFDVVASRAVAPLKRLVPWCAGLTRGGGLIVALKGRTADAEIAESRRVVSRVSTGAPRVTTYGRGLVQDPTTVVEIRADRLGRPAQ